VGNGNDENAGGDGESKGAVSEVLSNGHAAVAMAYSDTIAGSVKRSRTAPSFAPVSTAEQSALRPKSRSRFFSELM
jgi:hypothetical protein